MSEAECYAIGCHEVVGAEFIMCRRHWWKVPPLTRRLIWASAGLPSKRAQYRQARALAVVQVADLERREVPEVYRRMAAGETIEEVAANG